MIRVKLRSRLSSFTAEIDCIVTDQITGKIPAVTIKHQIFRLPAGLELADPRFNVVADVDMLIGADLFWRLLCIGQVSPTVDHSIFQKTRFSWVLARRWAGRVVQGTRIARSSRVDRQIYTNE